MREILFRGKRLDNGEWVEGSYLHINDAIEGYGDIIVQSNAAIYAAHTDSDMGIEGGGWYRVDPATVGQFTGLHDDSDDHVRVFEGDIVEMSSDIIGYEYDGFVGTVVYEEYGFFVDNGEDACTLFNECGYVKALGNIHDRKDGDT